MASQMGDPTVFDLLFVVLLLSATASILLLCRYLNTRGEQDAPQSLTRAELRFPVVNSTESTAGNLSSARRH